MSEPREHTWQPQWLEHLGMEWDACTECGAVRHAMWNPPCPGRPKSGRSAEAAR